MNTHLVSLPPSGPVTGTTLAILSTAGVSFPVTGLRAPVTLQLTAMLHSPANKTLEVMLAYQASDGGLTPLPRTALRSSAGKPVKLTSAALDVTTFFKKGGIFVVRLVGRVTGGTGQLDAPMVLVMAGAG